MTLREIIAAFVATETGLEVAVPHPVRLKRVWPLLAPGAAVLETPCTMHQVRRLTGDRINGSRRSDFAITIRLLLAPFGPQSDVWSEVALAFDEALVAAFDANVMLASTAHQRIIDEQSEWQPAITDWNGAAYVSWDALYKVTAHDLATIAA